MKIALLLSCVLFVCAAQAEIFVISNNPNTTIKKEKVEVGKRCVEWDSSGHEPLCVKEEIVYAEVATVSWGDEEDE